MDILMQEKEGPEGFKRKKHSKFGLNEPVSLNEDSHLIV
jgi:hypothetical protein